jgi:tetratricopeptide (TPR) repeat protein
MDEGGRREAAEAYFRQAYEHQVKGELDEAIRLYRLSIEAHPTAEAHTFLGWTYSFQGRYDEAIPSATGPSRWTRTSATPTTTSGPI